MAGGRRSILIDARVNALPGAHGLARSVMKLVAHMREPDDGLALRRAAVMTAPSQASLADIRRHYPAAPNPTLIPNGVDVRPFEQVTATAVAAARDRYQLPRKFILAVGAHRPHKNHEVLVQAMAAVPGDVGLVIVGHPDHSFRNPLPGMIAGLGLESRVKLVPDVADEWLPAVYRAASVFAFPSLAEGYGLPVLEAMAAGVPVVMSDIRVMAEVAGSAALMVPPRDVAGWASAITAVLSDAALAGRLAEAGRAAATAASWEHGASALSRLLSAVATGRLARSGMTGPAPAPTQPQPVADYSSIA
jgi:glycosyltransferase involved in cell wall biosynthesis